MNRNKIKSFIFGISLVLVSFFSFNSVNGQVANDVPNIALIPFGGPIINTVYCTCSHNFYITIFDFRLKTPFPFIYQPGISRLNSWYNFVTPSVMTLGTLTPGGRCLMSVSGSDCESFGSPVGTVSPFPASGFGTGAGPYVSPTP